MGHLLIDSSNTNISKKSFTFRESDRYKNGLRRLPIGDVDIYPIWLAAEIGYTFTNRALQIAIRALNAALSPMYLILNVVLLSFHFRRLRPDVIHINNGGFPGAISCRSAAIAARICSIPIRVMVVNNMAVPYRQLSRQIDFLFDVIVKKCVTKFITGSEAAKKQLCTVLKIHESKCEVIHNGVITPVPDETRTETLARLGLERFDKQMILGVIANLEARKGHTILINAISELLTRIPSLSNEFILLIEGEGSLHDSVLMMLQDTGLSNLVFIVPTETNIGNLYAIIDVLILPSISNEDLPNVISEAFSNGIPVIATDVGGINEQIENGINGTLVGPSEIYELANAIKEIITDTNLRTAMGVNARKTYFERFGVDRSIAKYARIYEFSKTHSTSLNTTRGSA